MMSVVDGVVLAASNAPGVLILVKATLVLTAALIAVRLARRTRASIRHAILAAALGALMVLPITSIVAPPVRIALAVAAQERTAPAPSPGAIGAIATAVAPREGASAAMRRSSHPSLSTIVFGMWLAGTALFLAPMIVGLWQIRSIRRYGLRWIRGQTAAERLALGSGIRRRIDVLFYEPLAGPMTCGVRHPAIVFPPDAQGWDEEDLNRAIVHELEHVRRGDWIWHCLARAVCSVYWFHPLVWMAWRLLALEGERSCDDAVLTRSDATAYADQLVGIAQRLSATRKSLALAMANRSDLSARVGALLDSRQRRGRPGPRAVAFACAAAAALAGAISPLQMVAKPQTPSAQPASAPRKPVIEVASIRRNLNGGRTRIGFAPGSGRPMANNVTLKGLIKWAYDVEDYQIEGGPKWIDSVGFDITAKLEHDVNPSGDLTQRAYFREMIQPLLRDRFQLTVRRSTRELPVYALVVGKRGPTLADRGKAENPQDMRMSGGRGQIIGQRIPMSLLTEALRSVAGRPVRDETGLKGYYDFKLQWDPADTVPQAGNDNGGAAGPADHTEPSLFTALQEQLGLRLEPRKGPVEILVIESAEMPSED